MSGTIRLEVSDGIATITIDRPAVRNAIDKATADALAAAVDEVDARPDVVVAILTGAGGVFSAGMDLKAFSATGERPLHAERGAFGFVRKPPAKPVIAAIEGNALGGGLELALSCDLIVAARSAKLGLPEVKRGLVAAAGGVLRLPRRVPQALAMEMILTGDPITAEQAAAAGLVNRIADDGAAVDVARSLAVSIAANAPLAVLTAKRLVSASPDWSLEDAFDLQVPFTDAVRSSRDAAEGALAFAQKRAPVWSGQ
ncbi:crotonase/enoyl-CoA hydratase family protein [Aeromicrobium fastidiosum]|uniref:enoyl-CoA hydratase n=1 Tax=Aeromicrobium fastidiosum TaxID=52699 RepID=A0A641AP63_9ACTN|nr:crotonase/enoyl-CoA hydratase family protein [Aeromicrobium fastidiosum]KAA1379884.1 crotonase/enoyl-CoA hydratase family protein [Aeromicrobium fastidiosum]MBP2389388.1 enoyl-CoA hydratase/carnithine racemase [Aeromicrobium fastidiosum]